MRSFCVGFVRCRVVVEKLDISRQCGTRKQRLEEIVTEQAICRYTIFERPLKSIDVIEALPGKVTFTEKVLINV